MGTGCENQYERDDNQGQARRYHGDVCGLVILLPDKLDRSLDQGRKEAQIQSAKIRVSAITLGFLKEPARGSARTVRVVKRPAPILASTEFKLTKCDS